MTEAPKYLYRYRNAASDYFEDDLLAAIDHSKIYCAMLASQNDAFEGVINLKEQSIKDIRNWLAMHYSDAHNTGKLITGQTAQIPPKGNKNRKYMREMLGNTVTAAKYYKKTIKLMSELWKRNNAIACFSEAPDVELMWAHYGAAHHGICVEWELISKHVATNTIMLAPITYREEPTRLLETDILDLLVWTGIGKRVLRDLDDIPCGAMRSINAFMLEKSSSWSYENEWRLLSMSLAAKGNKLLDGYKVSRVILGALCSRQVSDNVRKICTDRIPIDKCSLDRTGFGIKISPICLDETIATPN